MAPKKIRSGDPSLEPAEGHARSAAAPARPRAQRREDVRADALQHAAALQRKARGTRAAQLVSAENPAPPEPKRRATPTHRTKATRLQSPANDLDRPLVSENEIRIRAYFLFLENGADGGSDLDYWIRAERELLGGRASSRLVAATGGEVKGSPTLQRPQPSSSMPE